MIMKGDEINMNVLQLIKDYANENPLKKVMISGDEELTYKQLDLASDHLASYIECKCGQNKSPIAVYGHKSIYMLISMIACVKSGRAYCPIDISWPDIRVQAILDKMDSPIVLATERLTCNFSEIINVDEIKSYIEFKEEKNTSHMWVKGDDIFYILFTSGSSGEPKGVEITSDCLNNFIKWSIALGNSEQEKRGKVFLNQAPFSFDLSVMDLYTCMASGGTLWALSKETQNSYSLLMNSLKDSNTNIWVSTPSFAELCLAEKKFDEILMPKLEYFFFCGETLTPSTVKKLQNRFPKSKIINTYGPTESTVAVTGVEITEELCSQCDTLPVGRVKDGSFIEIQDANGEAVGNDRSGEIVIWGNTVANGYYKMPEKTDLVFLKKEEGEFTKGYRTGDEGYLSDGMLYYCGRMDSQVKLHGYRIEIQDIENNLLKLKNVERAVVLPNIKEGKVRSLSAYVICSEKISNATEKMISLKNSLKKYLPDYMIPKKIVFVDDIPVNNNGKIDRKALGGVFK
ncbi:MAG: D-alanine--poly(phosphoribitol) ligase subunit DltA [Aminipila sp.]